MSTPDTQSTPFTDANKVKSDGTVYDYVRAEKVRELERDRNKLRRALDAIFDGCERPETMTVNLDMASRLAELQAELSAERQRRDEAETEGKRLADQRDGLEKTCYELNAASAVLQKQQLAENSTLRARNAELVAMVKTVARRRMGRAF